MKGEEMGHVPDRLAQILSVMLDGRWKTKKIVGRSVEDWWRD